MPLVVTNAVVDEGQYRNDRFEICWHWLVLGCPSRRRTQQDQQAGRDEPAGSSKHVSLRGGGEPVSLFWNGFDDGLIGITNGPS